MFSKADPCCAELFNGKQGWWIVDPKPMFVREIAVDHHDARLYLALARYPAQLIFNTILE